MWNKTPRNHHSQHSTYNILTERGSSVSMTKGTVALEVTFAMTIIMGFIAFPTLSSHCLQWPVME